jgi:hypothetical protein
VDQGFLQGLLENLWNPATFAKIAFILVTMPYWLPLAKVMYREIMPALHASDDTELKRRPPGEDPFLNIPLASYRNRVRGAARSGPRRRAR